MLLRDLVAEPDLGLEVLAGQQHLDRPIRGLYVTDLLDPRRYLHGGELVLTGLAWRSGPGDADRFVASLAAAGVAGLAAGTARLGDAPRDLVDACRRHDVPVLQVPLAISFNTLVERVLGAFRQESAPRRELVSAVASGADPHEVVRKAAHEFGAACWIFSGAGWAIGSDAVLPRDRCRSLAFRWWSGEDSTEGARRGSRFALLRDTPEARSPESFVVWPAEVETEPPAARWMLAVRAERWRAVAEQEALATDFATAVALLRARADEARRIVGHSVETAISRALETSINPTELAARLETAGLPPGGSLRVVDLSLGATPSSEISRGERDRGARRGEHDLSEISPAVSRLPDSASGADGIGTGDLGDAAGARLGTVREEEVSAREFSVEERENASLALLREITTVLDVPSVCVPRSGGACALIAGRPADVSIVDGQVREIVAEVEPGLDGRPLRVGISDTSDAAGLRGALEEAGYARRLATRSTSPTAVVSGTQLSSHEVLLAAIPDELRHSYSQRLLANLLAYDRAHGSELGRSARMFLEYAGSWSRCAKHLHIHVNTLRYRIRRVEEITGCDLSRFADRVDLYLALEMSS